MANKKIKGITVEIGGDTGGLNKALKETNKEIRDTQSELRQVDKYLKFDPTHTVLLAQKQELLAKAVAESKKKLDAIKEAEKRAQEQFKKGDISADAYRKIQREAIAAEQEVKKNEVSTKNFGEELKKLEEQAKDTGEAMSKATGDMSQSGNGLQAFGDKATALSKKLVPVSGAAAGTLTGLTAMAVKAGQSADDLNTLSKQTGLSVEQLQKFSYASDRIDVSMDTLTGSMSKLTKNMSTAQKGTGDAAKAFRDLGVRVTDSSGNLRNNQEVFDETIAALGNMTNETQRDVYAMQIFGKSAQDLNPLILGGADALKQMGDEAEAAGLILSSDTLNSVNEFADEVDEMKAVSAGTFAAIGSEIAIAFLPIIQDLSDFLKDLSKAIRGMDADLLKAIVAVLAVVASLAPLLILIGKVAAGISALNGVLLALAANPIVLVIAAIVALVAALVYIEVKTQFFSKTFTAVWQGIKDIVEQVSSYVISIFTEKIPAALEKMKQFFKNIFDSLVKLIKAPINGMITMVNDLIGSINKLIEWLNDLSLPSFLGGANLGISINTLPSLPMLANGGIMTDGSAIVGDGGKPELLTVSGGRAMVQPLSSERGSMGSMSAGAAQVTNNNYINANNMAEVNMLIRILNGEQRSMRQGFVG